MSTQEDHKDLVEMKYGKSLGAVTFPGPVEEQALEKHREGDLRISELSLPSLAVLSLFWAMLFPPHVWGWGMLSPQEDSCTSRCPSHGTDGNRLMPGLSGGREARDNYLVVQRSSFLPTGLIHSS